MNDHKRKTRLIAYGLLVFGVLLNFAPTLAHESDKGGLCLSMTLNDPYNTDVQVRLAVTINKPFQIVLDNGDVKTTISGTIHDPTDNEYPSTISVSEWASSTSNINDTSELRLKLDRPYGYGPVSSFVYMRTITLSQRPRS